MLDQLLRLTGWTRRRARRALTQPAASTPRSRKRPVYDEAVLEPLRRIWAVLGGPCGKRMAPFMTEIALTERCRSLNPVELARTIGTLQDRLVELARTKAKPKEVWRPEPDHPWRTLDLRQRSRP